MALGDLQEEPSAGKPHARICEGESRMAELLDHPRQESKGKKIAVIAQINQNLPFMYGDAVVEPVSVHSDSRSDS